MKQLVEDVSAWNERWAREYDIDRYYTASHWLVRWVERRRIAVAGQLLGAPPEAQVVELGCGAGHALAQFSGAVVGLEIAPTMLAKAKQRLGGRASLVRADVERLPLRGASVRWLVCTEVIEHVVDPARLLGEMLRVLAPGGRAVVTFPNEALIEAIKRLAQRLPVLRSIVPSPTDAIEADWHLHRFSRRLFESLLPAAFRLVEYRAIPARPTPLRWACLIERPA